MSDAPKRRSRRSQVSSTSVSARPLERAARVVQISPAAILEAYGELLVASTADVGLGSYVSSVEALGAAIERDASVRVVVPTYSELLRLQNRDRVQIKCCAGFLRKRVLYRLLLINRNFQCLLLNSFLQLLVV